MKKTLFSLMAMAALPVLVLTACQGRVTVQGEDGKTDTIEFNTDTIRQVNISIQVGESSASEPTAEPADSLQ